MISITNQRVSVCELDVWRCGRVWAVNPFRNSHRRALSNDEPQCLSEASDRGVASACRDDAPTSLGWLLWELVLYGWPWNFVILRSAS
jgi:hypothetical protein